MNDEEKQRNYALAETLISEQRFAAAVIAGAISMFLAAIAYGIVVERWPFSYGFAAAGVGISVGFFIGVFGHGIQTRFSVLATVYTIAGCILGNLIARQMNFIQANSTSPLDVLSNSSLSVLVQWSVSGLSFAHFVFWFVAVVAAVFLGKRALSRSEGLAIHLLELRH